MFSPCEYCEQCGDCTRCDNPHVCWSDADAETIEYDRE